MHLPDRTAWGPAGSVGIIVQPDAHDLDGLVADAGKLRVPCPFTGGAVNLCQAIAGSGGSRVPAMALLMASSAVMPWAAAVSR